MLIPINNTLLEQVNQQALDSDRHRSIFRFHQHEEPVQRMINAIEPDSYVVPHKHEDPDKVEAFIILRGKAAVLCFDDNGTVIDWVLLDQAGGTPGVEIQPRTWHCLLALEPGTALYEVIEGPYENASHKTFASWAPPAEEVATGLNWLKTALEKYHLRTEQVG